MHKTWAHTNTPQSLGCVRIERTINCPAYYTGITGVRHHRSCGAQACARDVQRRSVEKPFAEARARAAAKMYASRGSTLHQGVWNMPHHATGWLGHPQGKCAWWGEPPVRRNTKRKILLRDATQPWRPAKLAASSKQPTGQSLGLRHTAWRRLWRAAWDGAVREARKRQRRQMPRTAAAPTVDAPRHCVGGGQCSGGAEGLSRGGSAPEEQRRSWVPECVRYGGRELLLPVLDPEADPEATPRLQ